MFYKEKRAWVNLFSTIGISTVYFLIVYSRYLAGALETANVFKFWSETILVFIPISIVARILIHIIFIVVNKIATNEDDEEETVDEYEKLIELKSLRNSGYVFMFGFILAMASQALEFPPAALFIVMIISGVCADLFGTASEIYMYKRGV